MRWYYQPNHNETKKVSDHSFDRMLHISISIIVAGVVIKIE